MSAATKRKYVAQEIDDKIIVPSETQLIVRVLIGKGNNLHEVEAPNGETFLVSMPTKFRKSVWIKRGDFLLCEPIEEGNKVRAEIINVLYKENIRDIQSQGLWPPEFQIDQSEEPVAQPDQSQARVVKAPIDDDMLPPSDSDDEQDVAYCNPNYRRGIFVPDDSDSGSEED